MVSFRALGPLAAIEDGVERPLGGRRQRSVLAVLLIHANQAVSVDRIVDAVWGDDAPPNAVPTLHAYVSHLRRILEPTRPPRGNPTVLVSQPPGYALRVRRDDFDVTVFEDRLVAARDARATDPNRCVQLLRDATAIWRGGPYEEFCYEAFAAMEIARLSELRLVALEERFDVELQLGEGAALVAEIEKLVAENPLRERLRALLMTALYRSGRHGDAVSVFQDLRRTLADELGLDPSRELQRLEAAILAQDPALDGRPRPDAAHQAAVDAGGVGGSRPELLGRDREVRRFDQVLASAQAGHGRVVLVEGEPGIGKSRLLDSLAGRGREAGATVVAGRCFEGHGAPPFWPWIQVLRSLARDLGREGLQRAAGAHAADLAVVLPEFGTPPEMSPMDLEHTRFRGAAAVATVLLTLAGDRPLVVGIDDVHRADAESLQALLLIAQRVDDTKLVVVCSHRPRRVDAAAQFADVLSQLVRLPGTERLALAPLARADVDELLRRVSDGALSAVAAEAVFARAGGNPFFVVELARLLREHDELEASPETLARFAVPAAVSDVLRRRLAALSPEAQHLVTVAAVIGREFDVDVVGDAADVDASKLVELLDEAVAHGFVVDGHDVGQLRFAHALVADTILDGLTSVRRASLHRRIAQALERRHGDDPLRFSAIAHHVRAAGARDRSWAVPLIRRAAQLAVSARAFAQAEELHRTQLEMVRTLPRSPERATAELEALVDLAVILTWTRGYHADEVGDVVDEALELSAAGGAIVSIVAALYARWSHHCLRAEFDAADEIAGRLSAYAEHHAEPTVRFVAGLARAVGAWGRGRITEALAAFSALEPVVVDVGDAALTRVVLVAPPVIFGSFYGLCQVIGGESGRGLQTTEQAVRHARAIGHEWSLAYALVFGQAFAAAAAGEVELARAGAKEGIRRSAEHHFASLLPLATVVESWADAVASGSAAGLGAARSAADDLTAMGARALRPFLLGLIADAQLAVGEPAAARATLDVGVAEADEIGERFWLAELHRLRATSLSALGDIEAATRELERARDIALDQGAQLVLARLEVGGRADGGG